MPIYASESFIQKTGLTVLGSLVTAIVATLIIGGFLAKVARRAQFRREDRQLRDVLIDEMSHVLGSVYIKLQVCERFMKEPIDGVVRTPDELYALRVGLDATYEAGAVEATALEARLRAYFEDESIAEAWHAAWDCLAVRYFTLIVSDVQILDILRDNNSGPRHTGLSVLDLADVTGKVRLRYEESRNAATRSVAKSPMLHGEEKGFWLSPPGGRPHIGA